MLNTFLKNFCQMTNVHKWSLTNVHFCCLLISTKHVHNFSFINVHQCPYNFFHYGTLTNIPYYKSNNVHYYPLNIVHWCTLIFFFFNIVLWQMSTGFRWLMSTTTVHYCQLNNVHYYHLKMSTATCFIISPNVHWLFLDYFPLTDVH